MPSIPTLRSACIIENTPAPATNPSSPSAYPISFARSAAREAFQISEIRREILSHLDQAGLARFMRVRRESQVDVARKLYSSMKFGRLQSPLSANVDRQALYISSVVDVYASGDDIPSTAWEIFQFPHPLARDARDPRILKFYLPNYHKDLCYVITKLVRDACPSVRRIHCEASGHYVPFGSNSWTVHCGPAVLTPVASGTNSLDPIIYADSIVLLHTYECRFDGPPLSDALNPPPSPRGTTLRQRFDVRMSSLEVGGVHPQIHHEAWLAHLRNKPCWADIWRSCDFFDLPVSLDDLASLYRKQIMSGHLDRLQHITAFKVVPWSITDFGDFSRLAGSSLTSLVLTNGGPSDQEIVSFNDLASLMTTIKDDLPNLKVFWLALRGVRRSEKICQSLLSSETLEQYGSITNLCIVTKPTKSIPFNVLRAMAPICASGVSIAICGARVHERISASWEEGSQYLRYLRNQDIQRRRHLAVVDFESMFVCSLDSVKTLEYRHDQPRISAAILREGATARVIECVRLLDDSGGFGFSTTGLVDIVNRMKEVGRMADNASGRPSGDHIVELQAEAQAMGDLIRSTRDQLLAKLRDSHSDHVWSALPLRAEQMMMGIVEACRALREVAE